jgi:acyl carrier protein
MTDPLEQRIIAIVQDALRTGSQQNGIVVTGDDSMETVTAWDSLTFMTVFTAINDAFGVDPDFDDAIHYTSVRSLYDYLKEQAA